VARADGLDLKGSVKEAMREYEGEAVESDTGIATTFGSNAADRNVYILGGGDLPFPSLLLQGRAWFDRLGQ